MCNQSAQSEANFNWARSRERRAWVSERVMVRDDETGKNSEREKIREEQK